MITHFFILTFCNNLSLNNTLFSIKTQKKQRYRFSLIVNELKSADDIPYRATLLAVVNCIIVVNEEVKDRVTVRNEFIGKFSTLSTLIFDFFPFVWGGGGGNIRFVLRKYKLNSLKLNHKHILLH